jgi:ATP-binding cassette subfamily F protein uup
MEAPPEEREMDLLLPPAPPLGDVAVNLDGVGACVTDEQGQERWLFRHLEVQLRPGQCTGIVGRNGAGKTTLLRLCLGEREPDEGRVTIGKRAAFNFIDQARLQLDGTGSVIAEVADQDETVFFGDQKLSARAYLRRFLFNDDRINERVDRLSGGERARLLLAKVLKRGGNILVLDEPTNDLDLPSLRILEEAISNFDGTVLVVSHDRYFLDRVCDQILAFEDGGVQVQTGNYSYYLEKRRERELRERAWSEPVKTVKTVAKTKPRKLSYKETRELESIESVILAAEEKVQALDTTLNDPAFYIERSHEAPALAAELEATRAEVTRLYARWEELETIRANSESAG